MPFFRKPTIYRAVDGIWTIELCTTLSWLSTVQAVVLNVGFYIVRRLTGFMLDFFQLNQLVQLPAVATSV